ncbi:MAG: hypothetical protein ACJ8LM_15620 [Candidatus Udaeobacter sp.]
MTTEERLQALEAYNPSEHLIKIKGKDGMLKDYLPAAWRFYELNLRYPNANFSTDLIFFDLEKNFCVVRVRLYLGADYETSEKKAESMKQGQFTNLDKVETAAKARCSRDLGIGTEYALEFSDDDEVIPSGQQHNPSSLPPAPQQQQMVEIDEKIDLLGVHQYRHLVSELHLDTEVKKWTEAQAFQFLTRAAQWSGSDEQRKWQTQPATPTQQTDIKKFRAGYGDTAVIALRNRIPEIRSVSQADFTATQADLLLRYLYVARPTIEQAKKVDPDHKIAKSFKDVTHPLDFYGPSGGDLEGYLKKLEEAQAKIAA